MCQISGLHKGKEGEVRKLPHFIFFDPTPKMYALSGILFFYFFLLLPTHPPPYNRHSLKKNFKIVKKGNTCKVLPDAEEPVAEEQVRPGWNI